MVMSILNKIVNKAVNFGTKLVSGVSQDEALAALGPVTITDGMPEVIRRAAADCAVLLKNNDVLPYKKDTVLSVFGRGQYEWFYTGYGSGGDVKKPYGVNLIDGIKNCEDLILNTELADIYAKWNTENPIDHGFWGHWPRYYPDMNLTEEIVKNAAKKSDSAVYIIGRSSGEDRENALEKGSYYLTDNEKASLDLITKYFDSVTVLLNIGSIIDMEWAEKYGRKIGAIMLVWQGGMESGNAIADLLCGKVSPSGKLADTIAEEYEDYPSSKDFGSIAFNNYKEDIYVGYRYFETFEKDDVLYPFGFGLSYTNFELKMGNVKKGKNSVTVECTVKNVGDHSGKEVVQVYLKKPCGKLGNPARELVGFAKTGLLAPKKSEKVKIEIPNEYFCSYDDSGKSGYAYSYVMEEGEYKLYVGTDVRSAEKVWSYHQENTVQVLELQQTAAPEVAFDRFVNDGKLKLEKTPTKQYDLRHIIIENIPRPIPRIGDRGYTLKDVKEGKVSMEDFVSQLDLDELEAISRGDYRMDSPLGAKGNAGAIGGVTESLRKKGVPAVITTDGPSGIRLLSYCSLIPIGTAFACSFDTDLVKEVYTLISKEMKEKGSDILLAPGMNIHRSPLCGRNFEYFSEDPVLSGLMAAASVEGIQASGGSACPKHFACNNQETNRTHNDSRVSERALREIYLKGFEICVKKANPKCIMTSYNKINGVWGHYHYELCERILRREWGYEGMVMTDWWMRSSKSPEFPEMCDQAYRVRAGVNVLMPGGKRTGKHKPDGTLLKTFGKIDGITTGEMQRTAMFVLNMCLNYID